MIPKGVRFFTTPCYSSMYESCSMRPAYKPIVALEAEEGDMMK